MPAVALVAVTLVAVTLATAVAERTNPCAGSMCLCLLHLLFSILVLSDGFIISGEKSHECCRS